MIAYCGLVCDTCPIRLAAIEQDVRKKEQIRIAIADDLRERYGMNLRPDEVTDCDGCRSESGRLFPACATCNVRKCARDRCLESCAFCPEYACDKLRKIFDDEPGARARLDALRGN